jgi:hypothetical protein
MSDYNTAATPKPHFALIWVGIRSDHRLSYNVHKQMLTINKIKGDPGECFEYFLLLF